MNILIDIGHPAQFHNFKHIYWELVKKGHNVMFTAKDKEISRYLLEKYKVNFIILSKNKKGLLKKLLWAIFDSYKFIKIVFSFKPNIILSRLSIHSCIVSWLFHIPHIALSDTEHSFKLSFSPNIILTGTSYKKNFGNKHLRYSGYIELCYLHPNYFTPDPAILDLLKVKNDEKYVIMRFVSWNASHDIGHSGLSLEMKRNAVKELSKYAKVFISSEGELPEDLQKYQIKIPPEKMHDALAFATLFVGEGATMASECACLGTPAIYVNSLAVGYCTEEDIKYNLIFNFRNSEGVIEKAIEILNTPNLKQEFQQRRQKMLSDKIDVTAFMVWFVENYPESAKIMKENPDYQWRFR